MNTTLHSRRDLRLDDDDTPTLRRPRVIIVVDPPTVRWRGGSDQSVASSVLGEVRGAGASALPYPGRPYPGPVYPSLDALDGTFSAPGRAVDLARVLRRLLTPAICLAAAVIGFSAWNLEERAFRSPPSFVAGNGEPIAAPPPPTNEKTEEAKPPPAAEPVAPAAVEPSPTRRSKRASRHRAGP